MSKVKEVYPIRKVIYSEVKKGTKRKFFVLLECGHVFHNGDVPIVPKSKHCCYCAWGTKKIDVIFWEHETLRWAYIKVKQAIDKLDIVSQFTL